MYAGEKDYNLLEFHIMIKCNKNNNKIAHDTPPVSEVFSKIDKLCELMCFD